MRKTIAFILGVALLAVALSQTACKPRDAKRVALALGPKVTVGACNIPQYVRAISMSEHCMTIYGDASGNEPLFDDSTENPGPQDVYSFTLPEGMWVQICGGTSGGPRSPGPSAQSSSNDYISMSLRSNCDPSDYDAVIDTFGDYYSGCLDNYLEAGTYYVVIDTSYSNSEYYFSIYSDECNEYHYDSYVF